jgi:protein-arginine kinase activator protein McsA
VTTLPNNSATKDGSVVNVEVKNGEVVTTRKNHLDMSRFNTPVVTSHETSNGAALEPSRNESGVTTQSELCANCGTEYKKRAHNHRFCSDLFRVTAWESKAGKKLIKT